MSDKQQTTDGQNKDQDSTVTDTPSNGSTQNNGSQQGQQNNSQNSSGQNGEPQLTPEQMRKQKEELEKKKENLDKLYSNKENQVDGSFYDKIINASFGGRTWSGADAEKKNLSMQLVDVVTQYQWAINKPKPVNQDDKNIFSFAPSPYVYVVQYRQKYGVSVTNIINSILGTLDLAGSMVGDLIGIFSNKGGEAVSRTLSTTGIGKGSAAIDGLSSTTNNLSSIISSSGKAASAHLGDSELLKPYKYMYSLLETGKKYCFPLLSQGASNWDLTNLFGGDEGGLLSKGVMGTLSDTVGGFSKILSDFRDITTFLGNIGGTTPYFTMYGIEKAKAFSFPTSGKVQSVSFPLFNTLQENGWIKNYNFITIFALRNLLFRRTNVQYYPPLLYDVTIPGVGRMPLCYVSRFSVKPYGVVKMKNVSIPLMIETGLPSTVTAIPQAWVVNIDFQSLIADSGNQFLSSFHDLPIKSDRIDEPINLNIPATASGQIIGQSQSMFA